MGFTNLVKIVLDTHIPIWGVPILILTISHDPPSTYTYPRPSSSIDHTDDIMNIHETSTILTE